MSLINLKTTETISLDFYNNNIKTINVKQLDTKSRYVKISCTEHGKTFSLNPDTMSAFVRCKKPDGYYVLDECTISSDGTLLLELKQSMISTVGKCTVDIMLCYNKIVINDQDGELEVSEESIELNGLEITDDNNGNVTITVDKSSDFTTQQYTLNTLNDIYDLDISVLSTMTFYLNVIPTAINHSDVASSFTHDDLIDVVEKTDALNKYITEKCDVAASNAKQATDYANIQGDYAKEQGDYAKEQKDYAKEQGNYAKEQGDYAKEQGDYAKEQGDYAKEQGDYVKSATITINSIISGENGVILKSEKGIADGVATLDENAKIPSKQLDLVNNLTTEDAGKVLDATQGKILNDLIADLQTQMNNMHEVHYGTEEPSDSLGKNGDIYMMIIDDTIETAGE